MATQTMVEKIQSGKAGRDVLPNDMMVVPVDLAFAQAIARFRLRSS